MASTRFLILIAALCLGTHAWAGPGAAVSPFHDNAVFEVGDGKNQDSTGGEVPSPFHSPDALKVGETPEGRKPVHRAPVRWSNNPRDLP